MRQKNFFKVLFSIKKNKIENNKIIGIKTNIIYFGKIIGLIKYP